MVEPDCDYLAAIGKSRTDGDAFSTSGDSLCIAKIDKVLVFIVE